MTRLERLRLVRDALEPQVLDIKSRSEHGLQGASGVIGQYLKVLEQIEELEAREETHEGTALDEFTQRLADRQASGPSSAAKRRQSR